MNQKILLETIGTIEKKEMLGPVGYKELVLEAFQPFPGYFGTTVPDNVKPNSLFAITRSKYTEEKIIRAIQKIKNDHNLTFDGSPGMVTLYNMLNPCIRFKDLDTYEEVPAILKAFEDEGIEFMSNRKIEPFIGIIKVKKYFLLELISDTLFNDAENPNMHYFTIPIQLRFNQFEKITIDLKNNLEDPKFDAALGTIFRKTGVIDVIRIYDDKCTPEKLDLIRTRYLQAIENLIK
ncbi:MAG: hypothetical protein MUC31_00155 [Bacteroidales bacterium]|jgi:hypothetical protein|nr:hypothetical protein [Bacteroidales bacterium]